MAEVGESKGQISKPEQNKLNDNPQRGGPWQRLMDEPVSRRLFVGGLAAFSADRVLKSTIGISPFEVLMKGEETKQFFDTVPERKKTAAEIRTTEYDVSDPNAFFYAASFGDSLGVGFIEDNPDLELPTTYLYTEQMDMTAPFQEEVAPPDRDPNFRRWNNRIYATIGYTADKTCSEMREILKNLGDGKRQYEEYIKDPNNANGRYYYKSIFQSDLTWNLSMGGNDLINLFMRHLPEIGAARVIGDRVLPGLRQEFAGYLPRFQQMYTEHLQRILSQTMDPNSPIHHLKRIFVRGIPDGFLIDRVDPSAIRSKEFKDMPAISLSDNEKKIIGIMTIYMNNAIKTAMEDARKAVADANPGVQLPDLLFESLDGMELTGIHPSKETYLELVKRQLERSIGDFPPERDAAGKVIPGTGGKKSFWQQIQESGVELFPMLQGVKL